MIDLKATAMKDWQELMQGKFQGKLGTFHHGPPTVHELRFGLPDGTRVEADVYFMGLDDPDGQDKIRGLLLTWAWLNEFREIPFGLVSMIFGRCGRYPRIEDGGPSWHGLWGDTNMPDADSWIYRFAEEDKPDGWEFFRQPGGLIKVGGKWEANPLAENIENLPTGYYLNQVAGNREDWIRVYLAAEYGFVMDGKPVYPEYVDATHCKPFDLNPKLPICVGIDFGLTPAATFAQRTLTGQWRIHSELVTQDMGAVRFGELLGKALRERYARMRYGSITGDPAGDNRAQTDESTPFQMLRAGGISAQPAPSNDPVLRRDTVASALTRMIDGEPGLLIHPQCTMLRKAMAGGYSLRRMRTSGERFEDHPRNDEYSHVAESLQYLLMGAGEHRGLIKPMQSGPRKQFAETEYQMFSD
jgi:hypothetical protein